MSASQQMGVDVTKWTFHPGNVPVIEDVDLDKEVVVLNGRRYTESDAIADSELMESTFEQRQTARKRGLARGGHSLSGDGSHSPRLTVTLPRELDELLRARAAAEHMSASKWARRALERQLVVA
ncbi:MAG: ribbon-helix-helix domain-containing protein [Cellulomonadaceae bacterium]|jgi:hypothetical protein|nr:ribbon-helix-helix domain-containing protein [Cellulomonadaceae bacterium]